MQKLLYIHNRLHNDVDQYINIHFFDPYRTHLITQPTERTHFNCWCGKRRVGGNILQRAIDHSTRTLYYDKYTQIVPQIHFNSHKRLNSRTELCRRAQATDSHACMRTKMPCAVYMTNNMIAMWHKTDGCALALLCSLQILLH